MRTNNPKIHLFAPFAEPQHLEENAVYNQLLKKTISNIKINKISKDGFEANYLTDFNVRFHQRLLFNYIYSDPVPSE